MELDFATRGLIKLAVLPPGSVLVVLIIGMLLIHRALGRFLIVVSSVSLWLLASPAVVDRLGEVVETVPAIHTDAAIESGAGAILVLLADRRRNNPEYGGRDSVSVLSLERLDYALHLHGLTGLPLVLSGGSVRNDDEALSTVAARWVRERSDAPILALEGTSRTTWQNLAHTRKELVAAGVDRLLLVTHAFHMPRALQAANAAGLDVVAAPFGFIHGGRGPPTYADWLPNAHSLMRSYLLLHEFLGGIWYRLKGMRP